MGDCPESNATGSWGNWSKFWTVPGKLLGEGGFPLHGLNHMGVSINGVHLVIIRFRLGFSIANQPFWVSPMYGNPHMPIQGETDFLNNWTSIFCLGFSIISHPAIVVPLMETPMWSWENGHGQCIKGIYSIITSRILLNWQEEHEHSK